MDNDGNHGKSALKKRKPSSINKDLFSHSGKWQLERIAILFFVGLPGMAHVFTPVFATAGTKFRCKNNDNQNFTQNSSEVCRKQCEAYDYDKSFWKSTIIMEWDLVCDNMFYVELSEIILWLGLALGTFISGVISDKLGRKTAIYLMSQLLFGFGFLMTSMPNFSSFVIIWFITGVAAMGVYTASFIWCIECVSSEWRVMVGMVLGCSWPAGRIFLSGIAYLTRKWRTIFQIISAFHILTPLLMNYICESPSWLFSLNKPKKTEEAITTLKSAMKRNGQADDLGQSDSHY